MTPDGGLPPPPQVVHPMKRFRVINLRSRRCCSRPPPSARVAQGSRSPQRMTLTSSGALEPEGTWCKQDMGRGAADSGSARVIQGRPVKQIWEALSAHVATKKMKHARCKHPAIVPQHAHGRADRHDLESYPGTGKETNMQRWTRSGLRAGQPTRREQIVIDALSASTRIQFTVRVPSLFLLPVPVAATQTAPPCGKEAYAHAGNCLIADHGTLFFDATPVWG
ncbi:hypothetical protein F5148DRAFT_1150007 [Russula earlei]|uniref:Uncharacterized protein n=1 Tax=Russula earlei TaxID=71964 RepID=A0ACC0U5Z6_9AGAM|nr:hypothetical protein F5148DRAFT_1150007 [Russula earlei]